MLDKNLPIGILDSGVGGLSVLKQVENKLGKENIIYFGDSIRMPYGNKTKEEIIEYANKMIEFLQEEGCKVILLACNTISSYINELRHNVPVFSIIKAGAVASKVCTRENIGLIATKATVESDSYNKEIKELMPTLNVISKDSTKLPKVIDSQIDNVVLLEILIKECIDPILEEDDNISHLILGCSHFPIIKNEINNIYENINLIDPAISMVDMAEEYLRENNLLKEDEGSKKVLYTTADILEFVSYIKRLSINIDKLEKVKLFESD